jgi:hypothetical protein
MFASDSATIRSRFDSLWPSQFSPRIPHTWGDTNYDAPEGSPWVRLTILPGQQQQAEMGQTRRFRRVGVVVVDIFVPAGSGDGQAKLMGDAVANIFLGRTVSGVIFRATSLERVQVDGAWLQYSASTPYQADSII